MGIVNTTKKLTVKKEKLASPIVPEQADLTLALQNAVDDHIAGTIKRRDKVIDAFSPSNTNMCPRYNVYLLRDRVEPEPDHGPRTQRIFDNGNDVHTRICGYLSKMGILIEEEYPVVWKSPPIKGTCDGIIEWDGRKLIELKSINDSGFGFRKAYNKAKDEHFRQAQIYMKCLDLDSGFVIYENKNDQHLLPIFIERDDVFVAKLFKKYDKMYSAFQSGILPARPYKETSDKCKYCKLKKRCWEDTEVDQAI